MTGASKSIRSHETCRFSSAPRRSSESYELCMLGGVGVPYQSIVPADVLNKYEVHEWRNASAVLSVEFHQEWSEILHALRNFKLRRSEILRPGGGKSRLAARLDGPLKEMGWVEKQFQTKIVVDGLEYVTPTHKIDCFKNRVALEVEWNNKDPFYDRDLNNFRLLFELRAIDAGIIITKADELSEILRGLGEKVWEKYGWSTTWMRKLKPRIDGGGGGGCPILVFGIGKALYIPD